MSSQEGPQSDEASATPAFDGATETFVGSVLAYRLATAIFWNAFTMRGET